jgi:hypothetical protein
MTVGCARTVERRLGRVASFLGWAKSREVGPNWYSEPDWFPSSFLLYFLFFLILFSFSFDSQN